MKIKLASILLAAIFACGAVVAQEVPGSYTKGMQRTGSLDSVDLQRQRIVVDDIQYLISSNVVVHSPSSYSVPTSRLKSGMNVGYKLSTNGRIIMEIWLLPNNYRHERRRR